MSQEASETYPSGTAYMVPAEVWLKEYDAALGKWRRSLFLDRILLEERFQETDKWTGEGTGTDFLVDGDYAGAEAYYKDKCLKMQTKATTPAVGDYVRGYRSFVMAAGKKIMVFFKFRFASRTNTAYIEFQAYYCDSTKRHEARIRYDVQNNKWQYLNSSNAWADFPTSATQKLKEGKWHLLYFSVDLTTGKYGMMWCAGYTRDLSACSYYKPDDTGDEYAEIAARLETATANQITGYFADLLVAELPV